MPSISDQNLPRLTDEYVERYEAQGTWGDRTYVDHFEKVLSEYGDKRIIGPNRSVSFADVESEVERVSAGLQSLGIGSGDVVSYQLPNWVATHILHMAISRIGGIANPIIPIYRRTEVGYILENSRSKCIIVPDEFRGFEYPEMIENMAGDLPELENMVVVGDTSSDVADLTVAEYDSLAQHDSGEFTTPELSVNDIHAVLYTSGTTADPKGVLHTHNTLLCEEKNTIDILALSSETTVFMPSPVTHITGLLYALEMPFVEGMSVVLMDTWDPAEAVDIIDEHDCNITVGATPFLQGLYDEAPDDWDCPLRVFACGGADIPPQLVRDATARLDTTVQRVYGSTEFPTATWPPLDAPLEKLSETDGAPAPDAHLKVVDIDTREEVTEGKKGELVGHSPELMVGYLGETLNEEAFDGKWFKTGDLAVQDAEGYIEITGRKKDIIIRGGENIPVKDVEDRLYEHPAVEEVAVVAMPDPELQEKGCAYIKTKKGKSITFDEMVAYLDEEGIAKQKYPERLEIIDEFPMTASGKIQKNELREDIADKLGMEPVQR
jgi:cyclohexanecarboxylate-CoA ligase